MGDKDRTGEGEPEEPEKTAAMDLADMDLEPEADEDDVEKTGAMSLDDLRAAGILGDEDEGAAAAPEKTQAMSLDDMKGLDGGGEEPGAPEKTQAMSLDEMRGLGGGDEEPGAPEKTQAMSLDDMKGLGGGAEPAGDDGGDSTMMLESPVQQGGQPRAPARPARLEALAGNDRGRSWDLAGEVLLVGRGLDCDVVLNDASVSRKHFRLERTAGGWRMVDLGSGNGTKVDGRRVQQEELKDASTLEVGQTTLRWHAEQAAPEPAVPPAAERTMALDASGAGFKGFGDEDEDADRTQIGELAALEVLPDWAEREAAQEQARATPQPPAKGGAGKAVGVAIAAVVLLVGGFLAVDLLAGLGIVFDAGDEAEEAPAATAVPEGPDPEAVALVEEGLEAFKDKRWYDARARFREALDLDPDVRGAEEGLAGVEAEIVAWKAFETADKALEEREHAEALTHLAKIDDASSYYPQAQDLTKQARDGLVQEQLARARELEEAGDIEEARAAVVEALEAAPEDTDALAMQNQLAHAEVEPEEEAKPKAAARPRKRRRPQVKPADFEFGLQAYAAKDFGEAASAFRAIAGDKVSERDRAKAERLADAVGRFEDAWSKGMKSAGAYESSAAITELTSARKLDASISGAHQGEIKTALSKQHAYLASMAYQKSDFGKAGNQARKALALDSSQEAAKKIYTEVQAKAQAWLDTARRKADSNPDEAMQLLSKVLSVYPRGDARYKEAYKLLNELGEQAGQ